MNTDRFISATNACANQLQNDLDAVCNVKSVSAPLPIKIIPVSPITLPGGGERPPIGPPLSLQELQQLNVLVLLQGRSDLSAEQQALYDSLYQRYTANGGTFPIVLPVDPNNPTNPTNPNAGSFATHSIESILDFLNFIKASVIILMGSSLYPPLVIPTNIIVISSFIYACRNQIKKFTFKLNIHGHK